MTEEEKKKAKIIKGIYSVLLSNSIAYSIGIDNTSIIKDSYLYANQIKVATKKLNNLLMDYDVSLIRIIKTAVKFMANISNVLDDTYEGKLSELEALINKKLYCDLKIPGIRVAIITKTILCNLFIKAAVDNLNTQSEIIKELHVIDKEGRKLDVDDMFGKLSLKEALRQSNLLTEYIYKRFKLPDDLLSDNSIQKLYTKISGSIVSEKTIKKVIDYAEKLEKLEKKAKK